MSLFEFSKAPSWADEVEKWLYKKSNRPFDKMRVQKPLRPTDLKQCEKINRKYSCWYDIRDNIIVVCYKNYLYRIENTEKNTKKLDYFNFEQVDGASIYYNI